MTRAKDGVAAWLLLATFLVAVAGLVYELIAGTAASYLLGDSVTQFSLVIGIFLTAMGIGAWLSRYVQVAERGFVASQTGLGLIGGFSAPILFLAFAYLGQIHLILFSVVVAVGVLAGVEIPLITRMLQDRKALEHVLSSVLAVDYAGALVAALLFPLLIVPQLGLLSASLVFGILNMLVAGLTIWLFRAQLGGWIKVVWGLGLAALLIALLSSDRLVSWSDAALFEDDVILSEETPYQRIVLTRFRERFRLFLNGAIQFDSLDEYRYHEALVHPAMAAAPSRRHVLVLGGGDGLAVREVLRWDDVVQVSVVDLDARVTELFQTRPNLIALNDAALLDPRVKVVNDDAWTFVASDQGIYDVVVLDLPDPRTIDVSKLYSVEFYARLMERIRSTSIIVTQAGSPVFARQAYWSVAATLDQTRNPSVPAASLEILPYHAYVPSFGDWGFVLASAGQALEPAQPLPAGLKFLTPDLWPAMRTFAPDSEQVDVEINSIRDHRLVRYYEHGWAKWYD